MNRCFFCKGSMEDSFTNYMTDINGRFIIIKNVPCHRCSQCGEVTFSGDIVERIESIIDALKEVWTEIAVVDYAAA